MESYEGYFLFIVITLTQIYQKVWMGSWAMTSLSADPSAATGEASLGSCSWSHLGHTVQGRWEMFPHPSLYSTQGGGGCFGLCLAAPIDTEWAFHFTVSLTGSLASKNSLGEGECGWQWLPISCQCVFGCSPLLLTEKALTIFCCCCLVIVLFPEITLVTWRPMSSWLVKESAGSLANCWLNGSTPPHMNWKHSTNR